MVILAIKDVTRQKEYKQMAEAAVLEPMTSWASLQHNELIAH